MYDGKPLTFHVKQNSPFDRPRMELTKLELDMIKKSLQYYLGRGNFESNDEYLMHLCAMFKVYKLAKQIRGYENA